MKGKCDFQWDDNEHKLRSLSPTYNERLYLYNKLLKSLKGTVLDNGCGADLLKYSFLPKDVKYTGIDISEKAVKLMNDKGVNAIKMNSNYLVFVDNLFDNVISFSVMEHIADDSLYLSEAYRVLKKGGKMILNVPLSMKHWSPMDERLNHYRRYDRDHLLKMCRNVGFKIDDVYYGIIFFNRMYRSYTNRLSKKVNRQVIPNENSVKLKVLKRILPIFNVDRLFNKFYGLNIYIVMRK